MSTEQMPQNSPQAEKERLPQSILFHPPEEREVAVLGQSFLETKVSAWFLKDFSPGIYKKHGIICLDFTT